MRIGTLAKYVLLPTFLIPLTGETSSNKAEDSKAPKATKTSTATKETKRYDGPLLDPVAMTLLSRPAKLDPISAALLGISTKLDTKYHITEVITDPDRFWEEALKKIDTYYKIDTKNKGKFYIARYRDAKVNKIFVPVFDESEKEKGMLFPAPVDRDTPVAIIDANHVGLNGVFEVYDKDNQYQVKYKFSPLINVPAHTAVSPDFLINMEQALRKLPPNLTKELNRVGIEVMIGKNVEDTYYYYYPSWKESDRWKTVDPKRPAYEIVDGVYRDNRKYANVGGMFVDRKAIIPQKYVKYATSEYFDYSNQRDSIMRVLSHELGHALDYAYSLTFSDTDEFRAAHKADVKSFTDKDKENLVYFYNSRSEAFAELTAALLGGLSKEHAAVMLHKFPRSAEYIRQNVFPRLDINISIEQIRRDIYPNYLRKDEKTKESVKKLSSALTIPDMPVLV